MSQPYILESGLPSDTRLAYTYDFLRLYAQYTFPAASPTEGVLRLLGPLKLPFDAFDHPAGVSGSERG